MSKISYQKIYEIVKLIPFGKVATYGQVAKLAGIPGQARQVGYALNRLDNNSVPWHRVINAKGEISTRSDSNFETLQHDLLVHEGIRFNGNGKISLNQFRWHPEIPPD